MNWGAILRLVGLMSIEAQKEIISNVSFEEVEKSSSLFSNKQLNAMLASHPLSRTFSAGKYSTENDWQISS